MIVLGLHGGVTIGQHEAGAALCVNGQIVAACEEERFVRIKDARGLLSKWSIIACLRETGIKWEAIDLIVTPGITYGDVIPRLSKYLKHLFGFCPRIEPIHHQVAHLNAAFYGSGFNNSLIASLDATGDGACGMLGVGDRENGITVFKEIPSNNSLGFFYTLMTYYLGFEDGDEYKVMGLAPYGENCIDLTKVLETSKKDWRFDTRFMRNDPPIKSPFEPTYSDFLKTLLGRSNRTIDEKISKYHMDVAASTQSIFESAVIGFLGGAVSNQKAKTNLCFAGGTALNCVANRRLLQSGLFEEVYISPVASDRGLAIGCAYYGAVELGDKPWPLNHYYLGSSYSDDVIESELKGNSIPYLFTQDPSAVAADYIQDGKIVGWYQGRSEIGARALGNRSILARADDPGMKDRVNARIKYRESFRPFAPTALFEEADRWFDTGGADFPSMSVTVDVKDEMKERLGAITHVDGTARLQTLRSSQNEVFYSLIQNMQQGTGVPVVLNTSFNLKGQPIIESPRDAIMTFFGCGLDVLILGNYVVKKSG